jgi:hypothetical protein
MYKLDAPSIKRRLHTFQPVGGMIGARGGKKGTGRHGTRSSLLFSRKF